VVHHSVRTITCMQRMVFSALNIAPHALLPPNSRCVVHRQQDVAAALLSILLSPCNPTTGLYHAMQDRGSSRHTHLPACPPAAGHVVWVALTG
jgi:hypothetical protein